MVEAIAAIITAAWDILLDSSPFVLFGFLAAGVIKAFIPDDAVSRHLGEKSAGAVIKASLLGIPLPLCSCSVARWTSPETTPSGSPNAAAVPASM